MNEEGENEPYKNDLHSGPGTSDIEILLHRL